MERTAMLDVDDPWHESLAPIPTERLRQELRRREAAEQARREAELKAREVRVECPDCEGRGRVEDRQGVVLVGERTCYRCNGTGQITAYRPRGSDR